MFFFSKSNKLYFILFFILIIFIPCFFVPIYSNNSITDNFNIELSDSGFCWPTPSSHRITSQFGYRNIVVSGATSYHAGIDIGASSGSDILAVCDSKVYYTGFYGSGGYTIILKNDNYTIYYHHVSPNILVKKGDKVSAGQLIGKVGPKNVYGVPNNPYKDSNGNPTNGATTGPHLHITIKKDGKAVNPLNYI